MGYLVYFVNRLAIQAVGNNHAWEKKSSREKDTVCNQKEQAEENRSLNSRCCGHQTVAAVSIHSLGSIATSLVVCRGDRISVYLDESENPILEIA